jgi:nitroreductase
MLDNNKMSTNPTMSLIEAIESRRSVRGYTPELVPQSTINCILTLAQKSPSNCNVQPWKVMLASGEECDALRKRMHDAFKSNKPLEPDFSGLPKFSGAMKNRQIECAQALYGAMRIERSDKPGRIAATANNYDFFGAPHVLFVGMNKTFSPAIAVDIGMYAQTLMLLLTAHGIGSCAQASTAYYPSIVRDFFEINEGTGILFGISFGYEDKSVLANNARTNRADIIDVIDIKD